MKAIFFSLLLSLITSPPLVDGKQHPVDTVEVYKLIEIADKKSEVNLLDSAEYYYSKAGELARSIGFDKGFLEYTGRYTSFLYRHSRYDEALALGKQQLEVSKRIEDPRKMANAYNNIALQHQALGNLQEAAKCLIKALQIAVTTRDVNNQQKYNTNLGSLFIDMKDYEKGHKYARKGHELAIQLQDSLKIGRSLINLLVVETLKGNLYKAEDNAEDALAIGEKYNDMNLMLTAYCNLGDLYIKQKQYSKGLKVFKKALTSLKEVPTDYEIYIMQGLASAYKNLGRYTEADVFYTKSLPQAEILLPKPELSSVFLIGAEIKEAIGDFNNALLLRKKYQNLNDSLLNENTYRTIHELEIQYQTSEKEKILAENKLKLSQQQFELNRRNKWIFVAFLLTVILIFLLFYNNRLNKHKRRVIESQQKYNLLKAHMKGEEEERSRTARDLHDGVASILSAATMQLNLMVEENLYLPNDLNKLKCLLESTLKEVRNVSHNLTTEMVLQDGLESAITEFCNRIANSQLRLEYYLLGSMPHISKSDELILYRTIQEALTNILKHAKASEVILQILAEGKKLSITIEDNGCGFDVNNIKASGIGLRNLSSRIQLLNGIYEIRSKVGEGTSMYIECEFSSYKPSDNSIDINTS